jgi:hypothetical protein
MNLRTKGRKLSVEMRGYEINALISPKTACDLSISHDPDESTNTKDPSSAPLSSAKRLKGLWHAASRCCPREILMHDLMI